MLIYSAVIKIAYILIVYDLYLTYEDKVAKLIKTIDK